jgi:AcrR family transcriptional regulator
LPVCEPPVSTSSPRPRNARGRRTREALLTATRELLETEGLDAVTMGAVADRAGVSRRGAYLHFASRSALIAELFDHVAAQAQLAQSLRPVWDADCAEDALQAWAEHLIRYHPQLIALDRALRAAADRDADAARHLARVRSAQLANCRRLATRLADDGRLSPPWTIATARDLLYALISSELIGAILHEQGWPSDAAARRLGLLFKRTLLTDG